MSGFLSVAGRAAFQLAYQVSPIILNNGIASGFGVEGMLPIVVLTESISIVNGLLTGSFPTSLDDAFAQFLPLPGATLISNQIGMYPFANQQVAANAIIAQPLTVSLLMRCPVKDTGGYVAKIATITALQTALSQHNAAGGTYTIVTPSFVYTNCILVNMQDVTGGEGRQPQIDWQLDFVKPLITLAQATQAYNAQMTQAAAGLPPGGAANTALPGILGSNVSTAPVVPVTQETLAPLQ